MRCWLSIDCRNAVVADLHKLSFVDQLGAAVLVRCRSRISRSSFQLTGPMTIARRHAAPFLVLHELLDGLAIENVSISSAISIGCYNSPCTTSSAIATTTRLRPNSSSDRSCTGPSGCCSGHADCQWQGGRSDLEDRAVDRESYTLQRLRQFIEQKEPVAVRGLIRRAAQAWACASPTNSEAFPKSSSAAKVQRFYAGEASFVYPNRYIIGWITVRNYHKQWFDRPDERKRASWTTMFTGWLEAVLPVCSSS